MGTLSWNPGRITGIASSNDDGLTAGSTAYAYEAHGRLSRVTLRNGAYSDYRYDRGGRLTRLANYHSAYDDGQGVTRRLSTAFDYNYDDNGNITEIIQDFVGAEVVTDYAYDEINRLTREATCDFMKQYLYDDGGNRTKLIHMNAVYSKDGNGRIVSMLTKASESNQGLTKTYYYANFTELTKMTASEYGGTTRDYTYEHDMAGRLTRQVQNVFTPNSTTTYNYEWDALDRMTKVQRVASGVTKTINYTYNAAGLRVRRVDTSTNITKLWTYEGDNIASVQESAGGSYGAADYVYTVGPGAINNVTERHLHTDTGTDSRYYQYDHRGNVAAVTDSTGKILRGYQYDAFGNIPFSFATGQSGAAPTDDILFTGKDLDPDTGLYYFNARWYDGEQGRFVNRTWLSPATEHPYGFCFANSLSYGDPNGTLPTTVVGGIIGGTGGAGFGFAYTSLSDVPDWVRTQREYVCYLGCMTGAASVGGAAAGAAVGAVADLGLGMQVGVAVVGGVAGASATKALESLCQRSCQDCETVRRNRRANETDCAKWCEKNASPSIRKACMKGCLNANNSFGSGVGSGITTDV